MKKYLQLAQQLRDQIEQHHFRQGELLPSIRNMAQQLSCSKNTVISAYNVLEDEGLIEPKNRSGFSVCIKTQATKSDALPTPKKVTLGATALNVIRAASDPQGVTLGSAHPAITFPAYRQFYRLLARASQQQSQRSVAGGYYTSPPGYLPLRQQIAKRLSLQGKHVDPAEIMITNGAMEAISLSLLSIAKAGDIIAVERPAYYGNLNCIEALGMKVLEIPCAENTGMDVEILKDALIQWPVKAILVNPSFNNPLGSSMPRDSRVALIELAEQYEIPIIEDDTFSELCYEGTPEPTLQQLDNSDWVISCSSLSKTLDSDIRLGWAVTRRYIDQLNYMKYVSSLASSGILQTAATEFLTGNQYQRHLRQVRRHYKHARDQITKCIHQYWPTQVQITRPQGGFLLWCTLPEGIDGDDIYYQAQKYGINIVPGSLFSSDSSLKNHIRLNFACWQDDKNYIDAIKTLGRLIQQAISRAA